MCKQVCFILSQAAAEEDEVHLWTVVVLLKPTVPYTTRWRLENLAVTGSSLDWANGNYSSQLLQAEPEPQPEPEGKLPFLLIVSNSLSLSTSQSSILLR